MLFIYGLGIRASSEAPEEASAVSEAAETARGSASAGGCETFGFGGSVFREIIVGIGEWDGGFGGQGLGFEAVRGSDTVGQSWRLFVFML